MDIEYSVIYNMIEKETPMKIQYKDYSFLDHTVERELEDIITIYCLVDDLVNCLLSEGDVKYDLYLGFLSVLDYYLTSGEYKDLMRYLSQDVIEVLLHGQHEDKFGSISNTSLLDKLSCIPLVEGEKEKKKNKVEEEDL